MSRKNPYKSLMKLEGHAEPVMSVDFHPVKMDIARDCSGEIRLWIVDNNACICVSKVSVYAGKKILNCFFLPSNVGPTQIYKGWLKDGSTVVVKCLKVKQKHLPQKLKQHTGMIFKLRHRHLVRVLGHCTVTYINYPNTESTVFVVQEYIANGSLIDHLTDRKKREILKWPQRMAITMGITKGIQFLHRGIAPANFGNDLKIENILLDESLKHIVG